MSLRLAALSFCLLAVPAALAEPKVEVVDGKRAAAREVLVKFRLGYSAAAAGVEQDADTEHSEKVGRGDQLRLIRSRSRNVDALIRQLSTRPDVEYVEPNYMFSIEATPTDPSYYYLWGLNNTGQIGGVPGADIEAAAAWDLAKGSAAVAVGILDSGIDYNHPDLAANVWSAPAPFTVTIAGRTVTCPAGSRGFNAQAFTCDPLDDHGHGTHVAGTIGATGNNGFGVTGVNWVTRMVGVKMLDASGSGTTADAVNAIDFLIQAKTAFAATANALDVRVISASWGGAGGSQALLDAINRANANNILFVAAAGNDGVNTDASPHYPSAYNAPNIVAVAATDTADNRASFSNYGATTVDLGAPGVNILSTTRGGRYGWMSGTSMATPHVSGVAALALSYCQIDTAGLRDLLLRNVEPVPSMSGITVTGGRLNAVRTLRGCSPASFTVSTTPAAQSVAPGGSAAYTITATPQSGFTGAVTLSASGIPAGVTASFAPNPISLTTTASASAALTLTAGASAAAGSYAVAVTATSGGISFTTNVTLTITAPPSFTLTATTASASVTAGQAAHYSLTLTPQNGFSGSVDLAASGVPAGTTATFSSNPILVSAAASATLTLSTSTAAPAGTWTVTITATGGGITRTTTVSLSIATPAPAGLPPAPTNVQAVQVSASQLRVSWSAAPGTYSAFVIDGCQGVGCAFTQSFRFGLPGSFRSVTVGGVAAGQVWSFRMRADNSAGSSPWSNVATVSIH